MMTAAEHIDDELDDASLDDIDWSIFVPYEEVDEAMRKWRVGKTTLANIAGVSIEEREAVYAQGLELLRMGLAKEAAKLFFALVLLDRQNGRYIRTLGIAYHHQRLHRWARIIYGQALIYDPTDVPAAALRAECTLLIVGKREAVRALEECIAMPIRNRHDVPYAERAKALLAKLSFYQGDIK